MANMEHGGGDAPRVALGLVTITPGAESALQEAGVDSEDLLRRHQAGDWGDMSAEAASENEANLEEGMEVMSVYPAGEATVWVRTNPYEGTTAILLPRD